MTKIKYGFVVLNYINYKETIICVKSILKINRDDYVVVVIDNNSNNDSISFIKDSISSNKVHYIQSEYNGGYSYGNNLGIKFLNSIDINHIIIATSDTEIVSHIY